MRPALIIALLLALAACGQTGPLYLPDANVETPVEIRAPADARQRPRRGQGKEEHPPPPGG